MAIGIGEAMLASTGANILAGAFGGGGSGTPNLSMGRERYQRRGLYALENENIGNRLKATVDGAKAAGLHPLFAMGAGATGGGQFSMPGGQQQQGSFAKDALSAVGKSFAQIANYQAQADLVEKMNQLEKTQRADRELSNDTAFALDRHPPLSKKPLARAKASGGLAEYEPAKIGSQVEGNPQMTGSEKSLTTGLRIGDQVVQTIAEDPSDLADDPVMIIGAAMLDKNNRNVDFKKVIRDFAGWRHPLDYKKAQQTERTITKSLLWGLVKFKKHYQITPGQGR